MIYKNKKKYSTQILNYLKPHHKAEEEEEAILPREDQPLLPRKPLRVDHYLTMILVIYIRFLEEILIFLNKIAHSCHMKNQIDVEPHFSRSFKIRRKGSWSAALRFVP